MTTNTPTVSYDDDSAFVIMTKKIAATKKAAA
jgi:hypothetical protein